MKKTSETIVFFGNERLATGVATTVPTLRRLIKEGYTVAAVVANHETSRSRTSRELEIAAVAHEHDIPLLLPRKLSEIAALLASYQATAGILVAYGRIVPQSIIDLFPQGIINIHPSLLPRHRGPTPLESVILDGSVTTGVSLMQLVKAMDAGPIYAQREVPLSGTETKQELADRLLTIGGDMLTAHLDAILDGTLVPREQNDDQATYDSLITKEDSVIDWRKSAQRIEREVRAFALWPKSRTTLGGVEVVIAAAHVVNASGQVGKTDIIDKQPVIYCEETALAIDRLIPAGKQEMTGEAFLAGYKKSFLA